MRILVVDDDERMGRTLADILEVKGYEPLVALSAETALEILAGKPVDCLLTDIKMPGMNGVELLEAVNKVKPDLPVVLMTAYTSQELVQEGLRQGAVAALTKPVPIEPLLRFMETLRAKRSVVIVDDDPRFTMTLSAILKDKGFKVTQVNNPADVISRLESERQVVLLDMKLNGVDGLTVMREVRTRCPEISVIIVTGYREEMAAKIETALSISAYACLNKPVQMDDLFRLLREIRNRELGTLLGRRTAREK